MLSALVVFFFLLQLVNGFVQNEEVSFVMKTLHGDDVLWKQFPPRALPLFGVDKTVLSTPVSAGAEETRVQFSLADDHFMSSWLPVIHDGKTLCSLTLSMEYSGSYIVDVQWATEYCFEPTKPLSLAYEWRHAAAVQNTVAFDVFLVLSAVIPLVACVMVWNKL